MRTDSIHGFLEPQKLAAGTVERTQPCATRVDQGLVDIEEKEFHSLTAHQFFLRFKHLMCLNHVHFHLESTTRFEAHETMGKNGISHFILTRTSRADHDSPPFTPMIFMSTSASKIGRFR